MVADLFALGVAAPLDFHDADAAAAELANLRQNAEVVYAAAWLPGEREPFVQAGRAEGAAGDHAAARLTVEADRVEVVREVKGRAGKPIGSAVVHLSLAAENAEYAATLRRIGLVGAITGAAMLGLLVLLVRRQILGPLAALAGAARQMERGEAPAALDTGGSDEIGALARAFDAMRAAIFDREARIVAANRSLSELLDNMRQGIVVFGEDGRAAGAASRRAFSIFAGKDGRPATIEGARVVNLLYPEALDGDPEAAAMEQWIALAFGVPPSRWDEIAELAPREALLFAGEPEERLLELELRPITEDERTTRVMLLATDATEKRRLLREVEAQGEAHAREVAALRRLVAGGRQAFADFAAIAGERLQRCGALVPGGAALPRATEIAEMMAHVHTMRGEARVFDLRELAGHLDGVEDLLARAKAGGEGAPSGEAIARGIGEAAALLARARQRFVDASPLGEGALDQATVRRKDLGAVVQLAGDRPDALGQVVRRLASRPFGESAAMLAEQAPTWAEALDKRVRLRVEGREALVPPGLARVLPGVLSHFVRNAIAHGIEPPEEREQQGKPAEGAILLACEAGEEGRPVIAIEDDGRGLPTDEIVARAKALGIYEPALDPASYIVHAGFSTVERKTEIAGLGVGLAAARADLASAGYVMKVERRQGTGTRFVMEAART
jgi:HAMP domain-containing protein